MTRDNLTALLARIHAEESAVLAAGQSEYANSDNVFGNFERLASMLNISRESILLVYLMKHIDGIASYVKGHRSQREDVRGRIKDARAYLALLWMMVEDKELERAWILAEGKITQNSKELNDPATLAACRNIGLDLNCGGCASLFYTGSDDLAPHDDNCKSELSRETATPWKHLCRELDQCVETEIMVYTTLCPYCFKPS